MRIKKGVSVRGLRPEMVFALGVVDSVYRRLECGDPWLTSGTEGVHSRGSLHYAGQAGDIRLPSKPAGDLSPQEWWNQHAAAAVREALGDEFDVVLERTHIHIEFQPKGALNG